ncbi:MAG: beta-lactamase domain-containing protein [Parcubacteria group bacterium Gr01-1014_2]|nr:MAG: beta-lactamase domain-containing protein [Parcubacteria group bacterium Gr01-1014_2]
MLVAIMAGFIIFGLLRGQEILSKFLKSEPIDANLRRGELLEQIKPDPSSSIVPATQLVPTKTPTLLMMPSPIMSLTFSPAPVLTSTPVPTPVSTFTPTPTPVSVLNQSSTPTPSPGPTSTPIQQQAQCQEGQVDINKAPKEELIKIKHIGDVRADELITLRPFSSVDDLERVKGIGGPGSKTLTDIKEQGIACVE